MFWTLNFYSFWKISLGLFCGYLRRFPKQLIVSDKLVKLDTLRNLEFHGDQQHEWKKKNFVKDILTHSFTFIKEICFTLAAQVT